MSARVTLVAFALAAVALTSCGGGNTGTALMPASPTGANKSGATFVIHVPHASSQSTQTQSASRKPAYISPATQSITVVITPQSGGAPVFNETVGLTPTSQGCTSTLASTLCELQVALNAGSYDATLTTFDGANGSGNTLSTAQNIPFTIVAGQNNQVNLTLSGIPERIVTTLLALSSHSFVIDAFDADNNVIVGSGAPSFAVSQTGGSLAVTLTQPTASAPNVFTAVPTSTNASATLSVTASYPLGTNGCAQPGAVCTATTTLTAAYRLFLASGANAVDEYFLNPYPGAGHPAVEITNGVNGPNGLVFDASGNLFIADVDNSTVTEYAPPYIGAPIAAISNGMSGPSGLAIGANGNLFVANGANNTVTEYAPPYLGAPVATISNGLNNPNGLAFDANGNLFVASDGTNTVTEYASPYSGSPSATVSNGVVEPSGLALDAHGNLFVANFGNNTITEYSSPYTGTPVATISATDPGGITFDTSGNLFAVTGQGSGSAVDLFDAPFSSSSTPIAVFPLLNTASFLTFFNTLSVSP